MNIYLNWLRSFQGAIQRTCKVGIERDDAMSIRLLKLGCLLIGLQLLFPANGDTAEVYRAVRESLRLGAVQI